jgi:beta-galactosidase
VAQWGTYVTTPEISAASATVNVETTVDNDGDQEANLTIATEIYELDGNGARVGEAVAELAPVDLVVPAGSSAVANASGTIENPRLWGVAPTQTPHLYQAVTYVQTGADVLDRYEEHARISIPDCPTPRTPFWICHYSPYDPCLGN